MINKLKLFFNKLFSDKRIVISSDSYVRTIKFCKLSQLTIISVITMLTLIFIVFFCFGIKLYSKVDLKQRKIDKMAQDGNLAKIEIVKMINHIDKINKYFEKITKTPVVLKNTSDASKDITTTENENKKLKLLEKDNTDYIEDLNLNLHDSDLGEKKKSIHRKNN